MIIVFEAPITEKAKINALLQADPYAEKSFSRNGYKTKEGSQVGLEKDKFDVYVKCADDFAPFAKEKLGGIMKEAPSTAVAAVSKAIEDEESSAEVGFGSIFGSD